MLLFIAIFAPFVVLFLVFVVLFLVVRTSNRVAAIQRHQFEEFAQLRRAITELRHSASGMERDDHAAGLPAIGASVRVLQVGEEVEIIDGPHVGKHGKIVPSPDWAREGVINVEVTGIEGPRLMDVSKVARWNEAGRA
ncbi:KOW motif-containing protein [Actinophytocola algeriensis]|uniref:Transcription antitermination factor NusG n=1 Tax=Actinophytocola algeriensis TaxID=1768010 RepID=A0A7W7QH25_9PSEU|nr:KOW motif-containing protein [Actinophytocola algeriensis]MBB4912926.1 transcription antitermination factor NusG [Actinophytocola algeriensis]MBE1480925.1 transcription antitermination factor NusG [Actinophytocola algeriensis]